MSELTSPMQGRPVAGRGPAIRPPDEALLRQAQLFRDVTPEDVDALVPAFSLRELRRRQELFRQGDDAPAELYVVLSGRLAVTRRTASGQGRTNLVGPGETIGELSVFDPGPRASTAVAPVASRIATLDRQTFVEWCTKRPYIAERLLRVLARRLRRSDDAALDLMFVDVGARMAKVLLELSDRFGVKEDSGVRVDHGLSQQELAQLVGSTRETVNKLLRQFAERGWIEQSRGGLLVLDPARLGARARTSNAPMPSWVLDPQ